MSLSRTQANFVDKTIRHPEIIKTVSSKEEYKFKPILQSLGIEGKDWFHQAPFYSEEAGLVAVADFAFPKEKLIIELDGKNHRKKRQSARDIERDTAFSANDYFVLRIPTPIEKEKEFYWKVYIEETLKICGAEIKKNKLKKKTKKIKLFTKKEFEKLLRKKLKS